MDKAELAKMAEEDTAKLIPNILNCVYEEVGPIVAERDYGQIADALSAFATSIALASSSYRILDLALKMD